MVTGGESTKTNLLGKRNLKMKRVLCHLASFALLAISISGRAEAEFMINISQSGDNVVATGSGSINTDGLTYIGTGDSVDAVIYASHFGKGEVGFGPATFDADEYGGSFTSVAFGSGHRYYIMHHPVQAMESSSYRRSRISMCRKATSRAPLSRIAPPGIAR
jgi:hypothetical protein